MKEKRCFKLVCGAGNEDANEVEKLVTLYSAAGCNLFDLCAKPEIVDAAKRGLERAGIKKDRYLCCSVGIKGDPHVRKARINTEACISCGACANECLQKALKDNGNSYEVSRIKCIGCGKCAKVCPVSSIHMESELKDLREVLPPIIDKGIDCIELHVIGDDEQEVDAKWSDINNLYEGVLSICIDRSKLGDELIIKRLQRMLKQRTPYSTIIQADGCPMSGVNDDYKTTLQTVAMAEIVQNANLSAYIILSGGTNSKTTALASICDIDIDGIAIGSYARKIVSKYVERDDFLTNDKIFTEALDIAKDLVDVSMRNMNNHG